jgi:CHASE1-domain containing sensor protein
VRIGEPGKRKVSDDELVEQIRGMPDESDRAIGGDRRSHPMARAAADPILEQGEQLVGVIALLFVQTGQTRSGRMGLEREHVTHGRPLWRP